jgi:hypothetical protein
MYGRWNRLSMLCGSALLMGMLILLLAKLETLLALRGRLWALLRASLVAATAVGSTNLFLSTESRVYQEALMWGTALAFAQAVFLVCYLVEPKTKWLALACVAAVLAFLARISSGAGAVFSLALLDAALLLPFGRVRQLLGVPALPAARRATRFLTATVLLCGGLWAGLNYWKYGMVLTSQPLSMAIANDPQRLQRTKGDPLSVTNLPLTVPIYYSPSNVRFLPAFPWLYLTLPDAGLGSRYPQSHFDGAEPVAGLPATVPGLLLCALAGTALCFFGRRSSLRIFRVPLLGAIVGGSLMLAWGYITYRYLHDALPWLVLSSTVALACLASLPPRWPRSAAVALLLAAFAYGAWANFAFSIVNQRLYVFPGSDEKRMAFVDFRSAIAREGPLGAIEYLSHWRRYVGADHFVRGNVEVSTSGFSQRADQPVVRHDGPPPGGAEYRIDIPRDGIYQVAVLYASGEPRPLRVFLDGQEVAHAACAEPTGGWTSANQKWGLVGSFRLQPGSRDLALVSDGAFPVVRMIRVVRTQ